MESSPIDSAGTGGLRILAGARATDTVDAEPLQALVVELLGSDGKPAVGSIIRFSSVPSDSIHFFQSEVLLRDLDAAYFGTLAAATVDARGRASALVKLGHVAGTARVAVTAAEFGWRDTARFSVVPGNAALTRALPRDTALLVGATFQSTGGAVDRYGNVRSDPVTFDSRSGPIDLTASGQITTTAIGRAQYQVHSGGKTDTGWVSVVPPGTLAAYRSGVGIVTVKTDGSGYKVLAPVLPYSTDPVPRWDPSGAKVFFSSFTSGPTKLYTVDLQGNVQRFIGAPPAQLADEFWADPGRTGGQVYFGGTVGGHISIWRVGADGGSAELFYDEPAGYAYKPTLSPNRTRLAFMHEAGGAQIKVLTVGTLAVDAWGVTGQSPRWSPSGDLIAFATQYGGPLRVINADGTGQRVFTPAGRSYNEGPIDWSPDGNWVVARSGIGLDLIEVATGVTLPLAFSVGYSSAAWKP